MLVCGFFVFHLAAITVANVPKTTALGSAIHRPFETYVRLAGLWQSWDMFTTIPYFLDLDAQLVTLIDGREVRFGPMLPGLEPYKKELRIHGLFLRMTDPAGGSRDVASAYFRSACRAVEAHVGAKPTRIGVELFVRRIRPLTEIRRDGRIADVERRPFEGPPCLW